MSKSNFSKQVAARIESLSLEVKALDEKMFAAKNEFERDEIMEERARLQSNLRRLRGF